MIKTHCETCGGPVFLPEGMYKTTCGCGAAVKVSKIGGVGTAIGAGLAAVGVTKESYNQAVHGEDGECDGCNRRERWLDNLTHKIMRSDKVRVPDERKWPDARFVRTAELLEGTHKLLRELPPTISSVIGVARSGMLPAAVVAMERHLPLFAVDRNGIRLVGTGTRSAELDLMGEEPLLIDDTVHNGGTLQELLQLGHIEPSWRRAVVFLRPAVRSMVHHYAAALETPHVLEWNIFNCAHSVAIGSDMDGVICADCPPGADDDGPQYAQFLQHAAPIHTPRRGEIRAIITARMEKYREPTEAWLKAHGVRYEYLVMGPWTDLADRGRHNVAQWKAEWADRTGCDLFLESDAGLTLGMDAFCVRCSPIFAG